MQEAAARFGVAGGGDGGCVATVLVQQVVGGEGDVGAVVEMAKQGTSASRELVGDLGIKEEGRVVHRRGQVAATEQEHGAEREAPRLPELVAQVHGELVVEDVLRRLGGIAVGIAVPSEFVGEFGMPRLGVVGEGEAVVQVGMGLAVVDEARGVVHEGQQSVAFAPLAVQSILHLQPFAERTFVVDGALPTAAAAHVALP